LVTLDGYQLSNGWSGTREERRKQPQDLAGLLEKLIAQQVPVDNQAEAERDVPRAAYSYIYDPE
jgi:hypothetical protein